MCGRVVWVWDPETGELIRRYDDRAYDDPEIRRVLEKMRYNVPPASHLPVILGGREGAKVAVARWGFPIPDRPNGVFNTKIETARESPLWAGLIGRTHCVFPVKGFYEWRRSGRIQTPYFIHRKDGKPMLLAGLYGKRRLDGDEALSASVVTCPPNALVATLHDRMPVVLEEAEAGRWLHPETLGPGGVEGLADPAGDVLAMHEVTTDVNSTENDEPRLIEPIRTKAWF
ncbi:MAG: SOS response-associated peptidase [Methanobacteriota archaeon]